ncbi:MAG: lytic transglycosylase domain-containing protein [Nitrospiraceae bacterium]
MALPRPTWTYCSSASLLRGVFILLIAGIIVVTTALSTESDYEGRPRYSKQEIRRAIAFFAKRNHLDPALLRAVIKVESDFRHDAVSRKGAIGLMQLTPDTAATLRVADVHDPIQNIRGGARQLRHLLNLYNGDLPIALAAYNAGVHRIKGHRVPRIRETRAYVRKVLRYYKAFRTPKKAVQSINVPPRPSQAAAPLTSQTGSKK